MHSEAHRNAATWRYFHCDRAFSLSGKSTRREATSGGNATGFEPALVDGALHVRLTNAVATALRP